MDILTFFVLPIATIILAFALEKILRSPVLTALTFFAIYIIVAFTAFDASFLLFAIAYTLLAYIAALIAEYIYTNCRFRGLECRRCCNNNNNENNNSNDTANLSDTDIQRIAQRVASILSNMNNCRRGR